MPWIIGIDEAGYGPNLGPLVMTSVACRVPDDLARADLWRVLGRAVRRETDRDDGRLLVADSKVVYTPARGLLDLETSVLALLSPDKSALTLAHHLDRLSPPAAAELRQGPWYSGGSALPVTAAADRWADAAALLQRVCKEQGVAWALVRSVVIDAARFNDIVERWESKGAVLSHGLTELIGCNRALSEDEPLSFFVDKHGGRNTYAPMLQAAVSDGMVVAHKEGMAASVYSVVGSAQPVQFTVQPRADAEHFCVALASMVSKYLREVLMLEFNRFWQTQVPGLKPTAGYPGDAPRFLAAIRPALARLDVAETAVWRRK